MSISRAKEKTNPERALERALNELRPVSSPARVENGNHQNKQLKPNRARLEKETNRQN